MEKMKEEMLFSSPFPCQYSVVALVPGGTGSPNTSLPLLTLGLSYVMPDSKSELNSKTRRDPWRSRVIRAIACT